VGHPVPRPLAARRHRIRHESLSIGGFLFFNAAFDLRYIKKVCGGLVPAMQRRGLMRTGYPRKHFRVCAGRL
jgi:hypothetical protein